VDLFVGRLSGFDQNGKSTSYQSSVEIMEVLAALPPFLSDRNHY